MADIVTVTEKKMSDLGKGKQAWDYKSEVILT